MAQATSSASNPSDGYRILLDIPAGAPELGFPEKADALAEIVMRSAPRFAIGIFGKWGSGKTTLMEAIEARLDPGEAIAVRFSAWRYEKEDHLIVPLLDTIRDALVAWGETHGDNAAAAKKTAGTIGKVMKSILAGTSVKLGVPGAIDVSFDANKALESRDRWLRAQAEARVPRSPYHASFRALKDAFAEFAGPGAGRRIVVFVDDLDRCLPESALQVLESMKLFFDLDGFVFVVGLDREVVEEVINSKYNRPEQTNENGGDTTIRGTEYIKKIFQVPFPLAPVALDQLEDFLKAAYEEAELPEAQRMELRDVVEPHLRYVVGDGNVNPREIKRYINAYTILALIGSDLDRRVLLALQTIDFRHDWEKVEEAILAYAGAFIDALQRRATEPTALEDLDPELITLPDDFIEYVSPGHPGEPLLAVGDIERYVFNSQAARSTQDPSLLRAVRDVGELRRRLREAGQGQPAPDTFRDAHQRISQVKTATPPAAAGAVASLVHEDIDRFVRTLEPFASRPVPPEELAPLLQTLEEIARRISKRLLRIYRAGNVVTGAAKFADTPVTV